MSVVTRQSISHSLDCGPVCTTVHQQIARVGALGGLVFCIRITIDGDSIDLTFVFVRNRLFSWVRKNGFCCRRILRSCEVFHLFIHLFALCEYQDGSNMLCYTASK